MGMFILTNLSSNAELILLKFNIELMLYLSLAKRDIVLECMVRHV